MLTKLYFKINTERLGKVFHMFYNDYNIWQ